MAAIFSSVTRPEASSFLRRLSMGRPPQPQDVRLHAILSAIDDALRHGGTLDAMLEILEESKRTLFEFLRAHCSSPVVAKAVTLKAINIVLAKQHFKARSTAVLSRPVGLIIDPSSSCNLACPGCVHSPTVKARKIFDWGTGTLPESRSSRFLASYGPYAIHANFCNYGEPLVNPATPSFIREAKSYLVESMLSTNLSLPRLDAEACVASGLDYMIVSVDGATQPVYETFRRKGQIDVVIRNLERLVKAKRDLGKSTPMIVWRFLTFEHNVHEVPLAAETARQLGVDQFVTATPFDVTWDVPDIHVADIKPVDLLFNPNATASIYDNWNANPDGLSAAVIERTFDAPWVDPSSHHLFAQAPGGAEAASTCKWLYMSMSMDSGGRIFPCCGSPRPDADLVFAQIDGASGIEAYNSEKYRMSRLSFADMDAFRKERERGRLEKDPHCAKCDWNKEPNTSSDNIRQYFLAVNRTLFNRESLAVLSSW